MKVFTNIRNRDDQHRGEMKPENYRYVASRNLVFLLYGRTRAKMSKMPLPSCLLNLVWATYPHPVPE